ncbi:MAG: hypothetical protein ACXVHD_26430 [Solirubrobacteraceae bacterium]
MGLASNEVHLDLEISAILRPKRELDTPDKSDIPGGGNILLRTLPVPPSAVTGD